MKCCDDGHVRVIPSFAGFTEFTSSIPKLYFGVKSQEQRIIALCKLIDKLICYADMLGKTEDETQTMLENLMAQFEQFKESGFEDYYLEQIETWVNNNLAELYRLLVKQVFFGLTLDGHFIAYIPESWNDIVFDTGMQYGVDTYGRLILRWDVDESEHNVNQRPEDWS